MSGKIKVGIVGIGAIGSAHADSLKKIPEAEIVAACDILPTVLEAKCAAHGIARAFNDYRELLKEKDIDAVYVCTPNCVHSAVTIAALRAGKHVFCEKPMALNARQGQEMVRAAKASGKKLQLGMCWRQNAEAKMIRGYVENGRLGRIYHMRAVLRRRRGVPGLGGWFTTKAMSGGGGLIDIGVHFFDLIMWLSGHWRPERVSASTYSEFGRRMKNYTYVGMWAGPPKFDGVCDVDDYATGLVRFARGATFSFEVSWAGNNPQESYVELLGDKGGVRAFEGKPAVLYTEENGRIVDVIAQNNEVPMYENESRQFMQAILGKGEIPATGEQGVAVMKLIDAIYASSKLGEEVAVG